MKIAVLSEYFYPDNSGGTPTDLSDLWRELKAQFPDLIVEVITSRNLYGAAGDIGPLPRFESWAGLEIKRLRVPKSNRPSLLLRLFFGGVFAVAALVELLRRRRYDLVFIVTNPPALAGAAWLYRKMTGVRYVYLVHDLYPDIAVALQRLKPNSSIVRILKEIQRRWLCSAARVVVLGRCMKRHLVGNYQLDGTAVIVIPSWAPASVIHHDATADEFRRRLAFSGTVVLYAGNLSAYARIELFLDAARLLREATDLLFVFVGDGSRNAAIEKAIVEENLNNVRLFPRVPREMMRDVLAGCDIALISLDQRMLGLGVPSKLYAILAAGRAVLAVVPRESEIAYVIEEEDCGINVDSGSAAEFASAIAELAGSRDRLRRYGVNARRALEGKYMIENACARFRAVFDQCAPVAAKGHKVST